MKRPFSRLALFVLSFGLLAPTFYSEAGDLSDVDRAIEAIDAFFLEMDALHAEDPEWNAAKDRTLRMVDAGKSLQEIWEESERGLHQEIEAVLNTPTYYSADHALVVEVARVFNKARAGLWVDSKHGTCDRRAEKEALLDFIRIDLLRPLIGENPSFAAYTKPEQTLKAIVSGAPTPREESINEILSRPGGAYPAKFKEGSIPTNGEITSAVFQMALEEKSPRLARLGAWMAQKTGQRFDPAILSKWPESFDHILDGTDFEALRKGNRAKAPMNLLKYALDKSDATLLEKLVAVEKRWGFSIWSYAEMHRGDSNILASATHSCGSPLISAMFPRSVEKDPQTLKRILPSLRALYPYEPQPVLDRMLYWAVRENQSSETLQVLMDSGASPLATVSAPISWSDWCHRKFRFLTGCLQKNETVSDSAYRFLIPELKGSVAAKSPISWKLRCSILLNSMRDIRRKLF